MMNIKIICLGKLKESYLREMCAEYVKRLGSMCNISVVELPVQRLSENPSEAEISAALEKEGEQILSKINRGEKVVALCVEGKMLSSEELSANLDGFALSGVSAVDFIIGSSFGLSPEIKAKADLRLSMSPMTFPHQLARVMLLEQLYRAEKINAGERYHK